MAWPSLNSHHNIYNDREGASAKMTRAVQDGLVSNRVDLHATTIRQSNNPVDRSLTNADELTEYINSLNSPNTAANNSNLVFLFQQHSYAPLDIPADSLNSLLLKVDAFPALVKILEAFVPRDTDSHLGQSACHFHSSTLSTTQPFPVLEQCALFKYVAQNDRDPKGLKSNSWSIRNLGFYQRHDAITNSETAIFINVSEALGLRLRQVAHSQPRYYKPNEHWTVTPLIVISSLSSNWSSFTTDLHEEVKQLTRDAGFTDPTKPQIGEANMKSLERCTVLIDKLQHAAHAIQSNLSILKATKDQSQKRQSIPAPPGIRSFGNEYAAFENGIDDTTHQLNCVLAHIQLMQTRLDRTTGIIRDLISLRSTHVIEKLTVRSMMEARTVRLIAIVSLLFIPPTFTTSFVQADLAHPFAASQRINGDLDLWFWFAITGPLMLLTLGGWLYWDRKTTRKMNRELDMKV